MIEHCPKALLDKIDEFNCYNISEIRRQISIESISKTTNGQRQKRH
jgi:hypothetical protein